ncbi:MAG: ATP-dependent DNA helicase [Actinomycetota bacterium]|nr:ATP-dependent DNA helicase [Actinomycetota bacterium]
MSEPSTTPQGCAALPALERVTNALAHHEDRPAQQRMAAAVAEAIARRHHLIVAAGTGTGKSLAYLVPALAAGTRCVVATATKALQDQLAQRDLPVVAAALGDPVDFAVLKGRSNYICRQRVAEIGGGADQLTLDNGTLGDRPLGGGVPGPGGGGTAAGVLGPFAREVQRLTAWSVTAESGDRADLPFEPSSDAWAQVSVGPRDCPGAGRCPAGDDCFAEAAKKRAANADVVVVNTHLYAAHLASGGEVLPPHDVVVFDEAHELEDVASASLGFDLAAGRVHALARAARPLLDDAATVEAAGEAATLLSETLAPLRGTRLTSPIDEAVNERLTLLRERLTRLLAEVRKVGGDVAAAQERSARRTRVQQAGTTLVSEIDQVLTLSDVKVAWVEGPDHAPVLRVAPVDVAALLQDLLWGPSDAPVAVLTSATVPPRLAERIGLDAGTFDEIDVGSPFDYPHQALLYCPLHLPDPRQPGYEIAMFEELVALITAAEGRTLALFTSWRAMTAAAETVAARVPWPVLTQSDLPKPALVARFSTEEQSCLFATMGFWQGVDVPGPACSLVTIDRLPFPRPDDPLLQARRDRLGRQAFAAIDVPRAATLLAQGAGRLIRNNTDRGVVAVLDSRLGRARYRWDLVRALPPMARTRHLHEVEAFLAPLRSGAATTQCPAPTQPAVR